MRRHISTKERVAIFQRHDGKCHICGAVIWPNDAWDVEHIIPLAQGGDDEGDNLAPAHRCCHAAKTRRDAADTARAKRLEARHIGAKAPSRAVIPGSKRSGWKRKISGEVVRRDA